MSVEPALTGLLLITAATRILELAISRRNLSSLSRTASAAGAELRGCEAPGAYALMVSLHLLLLIAPAYENTVCARATPWPLFAGAALLWCAGQALRWSSVRALGESWNSRGIVSPVAPVVQRGVYRRLRHPNYLGVMLEAVALPLAGSAWISLAILAPAVAAVTWRRLLAEERLLSQLPDWNSAFRNRNRLFPTCR